MIRPILAIVCRLTFAPLVFMEPDEPIPTETTEAPSSDIVNETGYREGDLIVTIKEDGVILSYGIYRKTEAKYYPISEKEYSQLSKYVKDNVESSGQVYRCQYTTDQLLKYIKEDTIANAPTELEGVLSLAKTVNSLNELPNLGAAWTLYEQDGRTYYVYGSTNSGFYLANADIYREFNNSDNEYWDHRYDTEPIHFKVSDSLKGENIGFVLFSNVDGEDIEYSVNPPAYSAMMELEYGDYVLKNVYLISAPGYPLNVPALGGEFHVTSGSTVDVTVDISLIQESMNLADPNTEDILKSISQHSLSTDLADFITKPEDEQVSVSANVLIEEAQEKSISRKTWMFFLGIILAVIGIGVGVLFIKSKKRW